MQRTICNNDSVAIDLTRTKVNMMSMQHYKGFTLIELMMALVVIGILAAIAYPSFIDSVRKARRADAMDAIISIRLAQEKWRANEATYTNTLSDIWKGSTDDAAVTLDGYYKLSIEADSADGTGYIVRATPTTKGDQDEDKCGYFELQINKKDADDVVQAVQKLTESGDADLCWRR